MGLTAAMNLLGGIGTTCAAFSNNVGYRLAFKELMDYRWLYQILVVTTVLIGIGGIWATLKLIRGGRSVYREVLIVLVVGCVLGGVHYFSSMTLRGSAAPANVKFFLNLLTLIVFLLFKLPRFRGRVDFDYPGGRSETNTGIGVTAIIAGTLMLTVFHWAGPSHTYYQENWTYVLFAPLVVIGACLILLGCILIGKVVYASLCSQVGTTQLNTV